MTLDERVKSNLGNLMWQIITTSQALDDALLENTALKARLSELEPKDDEKTDGVD